MRELISQLFVDKAKIIREIEQLQKQSLENKEILDFKHNEWNRIEHLIDLFFLSITCNYNTCVLNA